MRLLLLFVLPCLGISLTSCEPESTLILAESPDYVIEASVDGNPLRLASPGTDWRMVVTEPTVVDEERLTINRRSEDGAHEITISLTDPELLREALPKAYRSTASNAVVLYRQQQQIMGEAHPGCPTNYGGYTLSLAENSFPVTVELTEITATGTLKGNFRTDGGTSPQLWGTFSVPNVR